MTLQLHWRRRGFAVLVLIVSATTAWSLTADDPPKPSQHQVLAPIAAVLSGEIVAAIQDGKYDEAKALLAKASTEKNADQAYYALITGVVERLAGKPDDARKTLRTALDAAPKGLWAAKLRYELATLELSVGKFAAAEALTREQAELLLAPDRKDRLAEVYNGFARELLKPDDPIRKPDPEGAYALLTQARELAKGEKLRATLLLTMAKASTPGNLQRATNDLQTFLRENPKAPERFEARLDLGEAQRLQGQAIEARKAFVDLARDLEKETNADLKPLRGRALYLIPFTYAINAPPNDIQLNLGVAAAKRYLTAYPEGPKAVQMAYLIGDAYAKRGKSQEALDAYTSFLKGEGFQATTDEAKRELLNNSMTASFAIGNILAGRQEFDKAVEAYQAYLAKYPNGPQSAQAQQAIRSTQIAQANDHLSKKRYDQGRAAFKSFVDNNPLDGRLPDLLYQIGYSYVTEKKYDDAITGWQSLLGRFPNTPAAAHAQYEIASIHENIKGDLPEAIDRFNKIAVEPWKSQAQQRVAVMESKVLTVITPRAFRSGETAHLKITTRNLDTLTFSAYKLNPEAYFRKKQSLGSIESLDIGLVAPDAEWTTPVKGFAKFKPIETEYELPKLEVPGVYVVKVSDEKNLQATTLVIGSDIDAIVKSSVNQTLVFVEDMKTGKGRENVRVLVSDLNKVILEGKTGKDGIWLADWEKPRDAYTHYQILAIDGQNVAGTGLGLPQQVAQGLSERAYIATDRPAYRPGSTVEIRGVVREITKGQYTNPAGQTYKLEVHDARGHLLTAKDVKMSEFGTFSYTLELNSSAPVGVYDIHLFQPGKSSFNGYFQVQQYKLEKVDLDFEFPKKVYFRGELIKGSLIAKYQYGTPLQNRPINVILPDGRTLQGKTDAAGKYAFELPTEGFVEEATLVFTAQLPQDNVAVSGSVYLAVRAFRISLSTPRQVYLDGEAIPLAIDTDGPEGKPTGQDLKISVIKWLGTENAEGAEREVKSVNVKTDPKTGKATASIAIDDTEGGRYLLRAFGKDTFGNIITTTHEVNVSGSKDENRLRLLTDKQTFKVGEEASITLHARAKPGPALLCWEADRIINYKIVPLNEGENKVTFKLAGEHFPNFTLTAGRMMDARFDQAKLDLRVERDLRVAIKPTKPSVLPGEEVEIEVTTTDQLGNLVAAEIALALVDKSLLRLYPENMPPIGTFFYSQTRTGAFDTEATNTFRYAPDSQPVPSAVVEEMERVAAAASNALSKGEKKPGANVFFSDSVPRDKFKSGQANAMEMAAAPSAPAPAPMAAPALGAGMGGGGMGGMGGGVPFVQGSAPMAKSENGVLVYQALSTTSAGEVISADAYGTDAEDKTVAQGKQLARKASGGKNGFGAGNEGGGGRGGQEAQNQPRDQFVETAYWNPSIVTGKDGTAKLKFRAPTALSDYSFTGRGVTAAETLVGQSTADLVVKKDFFVELKVPTGLTQGDKPKLIASVHHQRVKGEGTIKLTTYAGNKESVYPKALNLKDDGVEEIVFDPFEVPEGESAHFTLTATVGTSTDTIETEVPTRPWGVEAFASASGTSSDDSTVFVSLPQGRPYENPEMLIVVSPSVRRMLVELALGHGAYRVYRDIGWCAPVAPPTIADRASELVGAASTLAYLRTANAANTDEAQRLGDMIRSLVSELVTAQNDDGSWPWIAGSDEKKNAGDAMVSARVAIALKAAQAVGLGPEQSTIDKINPYLQASYPKIQANDYETRAAVLYAQSFLGTAMFETVNSLNRSRLNMSEASLAYLALTFAKLDRLSLAGEVLDLLKSKAKAEKVAFGKKDRIYWENAGGHWHKTTVETTALVAQAYALARPGASELDGAIDWLLAHRSGLGWAPNRAKGSALSALTSYYAKAQSAEDRYSLIVKVNDVEVYKADVVGTSAGKAISVPNKIVKLGDQNNVTFDIEGRGTFGYAVTLAGFTREFGPDQDQKNKRFVVERRSYFAPTPEYDGKPLPIGFNAAWDAPYHENLITQLPLGGRSRIQINIQERNPNNINNWERDYLVLQEYIPAGATLVEGTVQTTASHYELTDGMISFYYPPGQGNATSSYEIYGYLPGEYRTLPARLSNAYEPGKYHLCQPGSLKILGEGEKSTDVYRPTPDELYARGKAMFDAGKKADAAESLEALFSAYKLKDDIIKDAARMLLLINIEKYDARRIVQYFEVLKEKSPELVLTFDKISVVGKAYRDINEHERAYLIWKAISEASYLEDARLGEVLRQRNKHLDGVATLISLWREYPDTASIESDFFGLSQILAIDANKSINDPILRKELLDAGVSRDELLEQAIKMIQIFIVRSPKNPLADEACLAIVGAYLDLENFESVVKLSERFAKLFPKSTFLDSFQYSEALGRFQLGQYDRATAVAETIASATYKDASGVDQPSPNKWQAIYILGQIYDARREPAKALKYYEQVSDRFGDAAGAVKALTRKSLTLPEVTIIRPTPAVADLKAVPPKDQGVNEVVLESRNIGEVEVTVYPVDLMRLYLTRRDLDEIAGIDLAGITPLIETKVKLSEGQDFVVHKKTLPLPLKSEGAYLVMVRGDNLYASGIVLVTPLKLEVLEEAEAGRVRVTVRDAATDAFMPKVQVKVIGSDNPVFLTGQTDLRGVFVATGIRGKVAAIARLDKGKYAFHQGDQYVGMSEPPQPPVTGRRMGVPEPKRDEADMPLDNNLRMLNEGNRMRQIDRLQQRMNPANPRGVQVLEAK